MCLSLGDVMIVILWLMFVRALKGLWKIKIGAKPQQKFSKRSTELTIGISNSIHSKDVLAFLPTRFGKSLLYKLIPGLCVELSGLGCSHATFLLYFNGLAGTSIWTRSFTVWQDSFCNFLINLWQLDNTFCSARYNKRTIKKEPSKYIFLIQENCLSTSSFLGINRQH